MLEKQRLFSLDNINVVSAGRFLRTEDCFWLLTALAGELALEEILVTEDKKKAQLIIEQLNGALKSGALEGAASAEMKRQALAITEELAVQNRKKMCFDMEHCLLLSKAFVSYWLVFKLIELEWSEQTDAYENADVYLFLDGLISDGEELAEIEGLLAEGKKPDIDQMIYLRSNWVRVKHFWAETCEQIKVIGAGCLDYRCFDFAALG